MLKLSEGIVDLNVVVTQARKREGLPDCCLFVRGRRLPPVEGARTVLSRGGAAGFWQDDLPRGFARISPTGSLCSGKRSVPGERLRHFADTRTGPRL